MKCGGLDLGVVRAAGGGTKLPKYRTRDFVIVGDEGRTAGADRKVAGDVGSCGTPNRNVAGDYISVSYRVNVTNDIGSVEFVGISTSGCL